MKVHDFRRSAATSHILAIVLFIAAVHAASPKPASAQSLSGAEGADQCRDSVSQIERKLTVVKDRQTFLEDLIVQIDARGEPFKVCQNETRLYVPGHPEADSRGCVNPRELVGPQGPTGPQGPDGRSVLCYQ